MNSIVHIHGLGDLEKFAAHFLSGHPGGAVVGLSGELGVGKTTFVRQCVAQLTGRSERVASPSFVFHTQYEYAEDQPQRRHVSHFDLYRLDSISDQQLFELGYPDALERRALEGGFLFVEWPEKVRNLQSLALDRWMNFRFGENPHFRNIELKK